MIKNLAIVAEENPGVVLLLDRRSDRQNTRSAAKADGDVGSTERNCMNPGHGLLLQERIGVVTAFGDGV